MVYRVARRLTSHEHEARDLVQETYLRAYRAFDTFTEGTNCRAWLLTITYSVFVNQYRKARREPEWVPIEDQPIAGPAAGGLGVEEVDVEAVHQAMSALPEPFRAAVTLVDIEELSYEEAASVLDCPIGTLRSRVARGRKRLYGLLESQARHLGYLKS